MWHSVKNLLEFLSQTEHNCIEILAKYWIKAFEQVWFWTSKLIYSLEFSQYFWRVIVHFLYFLFLCTPFPFRRLNLLALYCFTVMCIKHDWVRVLKYASTTILCVLYACNLPMVICFADLEQMSWDDKKICDTEHCRIRPFKGTYQL